MDGGFAFNGWCVWYDQGAISTALEEIRYVEHKFNISNPTENR
jgi:hypothetical protein